MIVTAYRITKAAHASTIWTGIGAQDYGGRWNSRGLPIVYTAESRALAALEQLVHLIKPRVLSGYIVASISFDDSRMQLLEPRRLPPGWNHPVAPPLLKKHGDEWVRAGEFPVLAVPSAVVAGEWNYLFNPAHPEFDKFPKSAPEQFSYDARLG